MLQSLIDKFHNYRTKRFIDASRHREKLYALPDDLFTYWAATAAGEFKGIPRDAFFFARAADALMDFFDIVSISEHPCALPSMAADSVWHAWLDLAPMHLRTFCIAHFGRPIAHREAAHMPLPMDQAMASCLVEARRIAGVPAGGMHLPPLFTADRRLRMPHGLSYRCVGKRIVRATLDERGRESSLPAYQDSLAPAALVSAGLLREAEIEEMRRPVSNGCGGSIGDFGSGDSGCDGGDGGGDSGGCGGGCGGCGGD